MKQNIISEFWMEGQLKFHLKSLEDAQDEDYLSSMTRNHITDLSDFMRFNRVRLRDGATVVFSHDILRDYGDKELLIPKTIEFLCYYKVQFAAELQLTLHAENEDEKEDSRKREIIKQCFMQVISVLDGRKIQLNRGAEFTLSKGNAHDAGEIDYLIMVDGRWKDEK